MGHPELTPSRACTWIALDLKEEEKNCWEGALGPVPQDWGAVLLPAPSALLGNATLPPCKAQLKLWA